VDRELQGEGFGQERRSDQSENLTAHARSFQEAAARQVWKNDVLVERDFTISHNDANYEIKAKAVF